MFGVLGYDFAYTVSKANLSRHCAHARARARAHTHTHTHTNAQRIRLRRLIITREESGHSLDHTDTLGYDFDMRIRSEAAPAIPKVYARVKTLALTAALSLSRGNGLLATPR